ncbi:MAG: DUF2062 domain-containing protein [Xenococcaceae cyanobacterium MO_167.B27]|nr:DUF2062 domain-containing protein [Xenococcaceae cyanobacterium MO_167.B27]
MSKLYQEDSSGLSAKFTPKERGYHSRFKYWLAKRYRGFYRRLLRLRGNHVAIARGFAVGVFAGCFPFFGFQTLIGIILATFVRGSKVTAALGTWISNPITYIPLFMLNFKVGKLLLGVESISSKEVDLESLSSLMESGYIFAVTLLVGCVVVGAIASILAYFLSLYIFQRLKRKRTRFSKK